MCGYKHAAFFPVPKLQPAFFSLLSSSVRLITLYYQGLEFGTAFQ